MGIVSKVASVVMRSAIEVIDWSFGYRFYYLFDIGSSASRGTYTSGYVSVGTVARRIPSRTAPRVTHIDNLPRRPIRIFRCQNLADISQIVLEDPIRVLLQDLAPTKYVGCRH